MPKPLDLTGRKIKSTYQRVVQFSQGKFYDGLGNEIFDLNAPYTGYLTADRYIVREVPAGSIDGVNRVFTLANLPLPGKETIFRNGQQQLPVEDYTISGKVITFNNTHNIIDGESITATYFF